MAHLLLISIGPVQEFIASARRSRDLWFGSWLLSELSKATAHSIARRYSLDCLIFPAPASSAELDFGTTLNVANKILALIPDSSNTSMADVAKVLQDDVYECLEEICARAFDQVTGPWFPDRTVAVAQVRDLLEFVWVALPLTDKTDYPAVRARLEAWMAARKSTRDFVAVTWGSDQPKSSLDGQRESVIPQEAYPQISERGAVRAAKIQALYTSYRAGPAEQLSGVDLLKRRGRLSTGKSAVPSPIVQEIPADVERFASTSHIAALPLMYRLTQVNLAAAKAAWQRYTATLIGLGAELDRVADKYPLNDVLGMYEGDLLFEERLIDLFDPLIPHREQSEHQQAKLQDQLIQAWTALKLFFSQLDPTVRDLRPTPYYAVLLADGDRMGRVIDNQDTLPQHQTLSQALDGFAGKVRTIVEQTHFGALVYAGGDDVLAFVPLHTVLACARELATTFAGALAGYTARGGKDGQPGKSPTLSVGIVVAHHLEPLSDTLTLVRAAEKLAKAVPGKNALAITVSKRSGSDTTVAGPWEGLDGRLRRFVALHRDAVLPDGAAFELRDLASRLWVPAPPAPGGTVDSPAGVAQQAANTTLLALMATEAGRIVGRKRGQGGAQEPNAQLAQDLGTYLQQIAAEIAVAPQTKHSPLAQLADELIVAREFARAATLAGLPKESLDADLDH